MAAEDIELIDWPDGEPLSASRRSALKFPVKVKAAGDMRAARSVVVKEIRPQGEGAEGTGPATYLASAAPLLLTGDGDTAVGDVSLQLDRTMPPGDYVASLEIAGAQRDVAFSVVEDTSLRIRPSPAVIDTTRARTHEVTVSFENRGNIDLPIDLRGDYPLGREEPLAADPSDAESILAVLTAALNRAPGVLTEVGTVTIDMPGGAFTLAPGRAHNARISASWDIELDPVRRYRVFVPVFGSELEIAIVTAIKPAAKKPAARSSERKKRN